MKRLATCVVVALSVALLAMAGDVFQDYGLDKKVWTERFHWALDGTGLLTPSIPSKLKLIPPADRVAVVNALGAAAKLYFGSAEFKAEFKARANKAGPPPPTPARTAKQIADDMRSKIEKQAAQLEAQAKTMPAETRAALEQAAKASREMLKSIDQTAAFMAEGELRTYNTQKAAYDDYAKKRELAGDGMGEARTQLKTALNQFLQETSGVNYAAKTSSPGGKGTFVNRAEESKSPVWKQCFRAGREACEAARTFAQSWLTELK